MEQENKTVAVIPADKAKIKHIWMVTLYLFLITAGEFIIAFTLDASPIKTVVFILMTIVKAYYIMSEFMHLGHETKGLKWSIVAPLIFVTWLIAALLIQGDAIFTAIYGG
ncbi:cytochrome C oxidase subunit IV family protein [Reichenbachiella carrageenanivorans]|uniref:Cytochrome C oxidase subunit IV family protein n=1 Tax=Reichenbachiella carrageenanivorans TaxID=2979869 RepID=A0ABY6D479_9BACT|nr:cytochrome C oxidase subunit IV family protein [Reichenbachiella carrageenanivorans]UXX79923.1 cytochrome C oxidase subunit IV family protein [Reichenbachiella carrageenanivorans]